MTTENVTRSFSSVSRVSVCVCTSKSRSNYYYGIIFQQICVYLCVLFISLPCAQVRSYHSALVDWCYFYLIFGFFISITSSFAWINIWQTHHTPKTQSKYDEHGKSKKEQAKKKENATEKNWNMKMLSRTNERSDSNDSPKQLINFDKLNTEKKRTHTHTQTH